MMLLAQSVDARFGPIHFILFSLSNIVPMDPPPFYFQGILSSYKVAHFPKIQTNGEATIPLEVNNTSDGTCLKGTVNNGKLNGRARIEDAKGQTLFELNFTDNKISGPYKQYENGKLKASGSFQDSLRTGEAWEYENGNVVFHGSYLGDKRNGKAEEYDWFGFPLYDGDYKDGVRADLDYLIEFDGIKYKCHIDKVSHHLFRGEFDSSNQFHGKCIEVTERNDPIRLVQYDHGTLVKVLRLYAKDMMVEYSDGRCVFIGEYAHDPALYYPRCGVGEEYCDARCVFSGEYERDARNGQGVLHCSDNSLFLSREWKEGEVTSQGVFISSNGEHAWKGNWTDVKPYVSVEQIDDDYSDSEFTVTFGSTVENLSRDTCDVGVFEEEIERDAARIKSSVEKELMLFTSLQQKKDSSDTEGTFCETVSFVDSSDSDLPVEKPAPSVPPRKPKERIESDESSSPAPSTEPNVQPSVQENITSLTENDVSSVNEAQIPATEHSTPSETPQSQLREDSPAAVEESSILPTEEVSSLPQENNRRPPRNLPVESEVPAGILVNPDTEELQPLVSRQEENHAFPSSATNSPVASPQGVISGFPNSYQSLVPSESPNPYQPPVVSYHSPPTSQPPMVLSTTTPTSRPPMTLPTTTQPMAPSQPPSPYLPPMVPVTTTPASQPPSPYQPPMVPAASQLSVTTTQLPAYSSDYPAIPSQNLPSPPQNSRQVSEFRRGDYTYKGVITNGVLNGEGSVYYGNQLLVKGFFRNTKLNGKGEMYYLNSGALHYRGSFVDDYLNGRGEEYNEQGQLVYEGSFVGGKRNGKGVYYDYQRNERRDGVFKDDAMNGNGEIKRLGDNTLLADGFFQNDSLVEGRRYDPDTHRITEEGTFDRNMFIGKKYNSDGSCLFSTFGEGVPDGMTKQHYPNGNVEWEGCIARGCYEGLFYFYYETGEKWMEITYGAGVEKKKTMFYRSGRVQWEGTMNNGIYEGKLYDEDGRCKVIGTFNNGNPMEGTDIIYQKRGSESVCYMRKIRNGNYDSSMCVYATGDPSAVEYDSSWRLVYEGGWTWSTLSQSGQSESIPIMHGGGKWYLMDGRCIEAQWSHGILVPGDSTVYMGTRKGTMLRISRYIGSILLDTSYSFLSPVFGYHGNGMFLYEDNSYFEGRWENNKLVEVKTPILWENGTKKYETTIVPEPLNGKYAHEYMPSGNTTYWVNGVAIWGTFVPELNRFDGDIYFNINGEWRGPYPPKYRFMADNYNLEYGILSVCL